MGVIDMSKYTTKRNRERGRFAPNPSPEEIRGRLVGRQAVVLGGEQPKDDHRILIRDPGDPEAGWRPL